MYWEVVDVGRKNIGFRVVSLSLNFRFVIFLGKLFNFIEFEFFCIENEFNNIYFVYFK